MARWTLSPAIRHAAIHKFQAVSGRDEGHGLTVIGSVVCRVQLSRRFHPPLGLLDDMPGLTRQGSFLARRDVNLSSLGVGSGVELGRFPRVVVNLHRGQIYARERFDSRF